MLFGLAGESQGVDCECNVHLTATMNVKHIASVESMKAKILAFMNDGDTCRKRRSLVWSIAIAVRTRGYSDASVIDKETNSRYDVQSFPDVEVALQLLFFDSGLQIVYSIAMQ